VRIEEMLVMPHDDIITARAELSSRIAAIEWRAGPSRLAPDIERIRALAQHHHLPGAVDVANRLRLALANGERGLPVHRWLQLLGEAVGGARRAA
jgi:hypothetical protein